MKHILLLCMAVIFLLLMAGCTQTAQQGQPAATTTPAPVNTSDDLCTCGDNDRLGLGQYSPHPEYGV